MQTSRRWIWILACAAFPAAIANGQDLELDWANTEPGVAYVGTKVCASCHEDQHASYLRTTHSIATAKTDAQREPPPATYDHGPSMSHFEVERRGDRLIHREELRDSEQRVVATTEKTMAYSVGSRTHARSYLYRDGEFWGQSPLTWYTESAAWQMSPGFDGPVHHSFHRKIKTGCVFCHVGSIDRKDHNPFKFEIIETTIGCERCHGPGALHVERHQNADNTHDDDRTIVNPARLSRTLREAICQQCHLQGVSKINTSGHDNWDFRPGMPLEQFRVDYQFGLGNDRMRIVGHVEQMHASECYKQTETLTCVTCHNPHDPIDANQKIAAYRQMCLDCHQDQSCGKPRQQRDELADNSCYQCHMPKADTNVTHVAFHHHKIGLHPDGDGTDQEATTELIPVLDISALSERERRRCEALAKSILLDNAPGKFKPYQDEVIPTLIELKQTGPVDALSDSQLGSLAKSQGQLQIAEQLARDALAKEPKPTTARIEAIRLLAEISFGRRQWPQAAGLFRQATGHHREAHDFYFLGLAESNSGNVARAIEALRKSAAIDPSQPGVHAALQAIFQAAGQAGPAQQHAVMQNRLQMRMRQIQPVEN